MLKKEKRRILMIAATPFFSDRGCHIRIYSEIKYLLRNGYQVKLCTYFLGTSPKDIKRNVIKTKPRSWYKKTTPGASWGKIILNYDLLKIFIKEYKRFKPEIVHAHLYEGLLTAFLAKIFLFKNYKIFFDCQGSLAAEIKAYSLNNKISNKIIYRLVKIVEKILLFIPKYIICSSENSKNFISKEYKLKKEIAVLEDAVDEEVIIPGNKEVTKNNFTDQSIYLIYSGSINKAKGLNSLVAILPKLLAVKPELKMLFVGYGDQEDSYRKVLQKNIKNNQVIFTGRVSYFSLGRYLANCDYAIEPKSDISESSGKILNYMAAGLKIICYRSNFNTNKLNKQGIFIDNMSDLLDIEYRKKQENRVYSYLNWEDNITNLIKIYQHL